MQLSNPHQPNINMRRTLLVVLLACALFTSTLGWVPSRQGGFVPKYQAKYFLTKLFIALYNCETYTLRSLLAPDFKQFLFNEIRYREKVVSGLPSLCTGRIRPKFRFRIIARQDPRSFIVQIKVFKGYELAFTLNHSYTLRRRRRCSRKLKTCYELASSVNQLRISDLRPFGIH